MQKDGFLFTNAAMTMTYIYFLYNVCSRNMSVFCVYVYPAVCSKSHVCSFFLNIKRVGEETSSWR